MNLLSLVNNSAVNIIDTVNSEELDYQRYLVRKFEKSVNEIRTLLEMDARYICHVAASMGKDSSCMLFITLEAYRRCIAEGTIEQTRPLLVNCVDTLVESLPMKMYVRFASKRLIAYAKENNINLVFDIVTPPMADEYFIRWASGQKLIPSALRHGDCSMILKVDPAEKYVSQVMEHVCSSEAFAQYRFSPRITLVGSRDQESVRRSMNIKKQNLNVDIDEVIHQLSLISDTDKNQSKPIYKFAAIREWLTSEVFDLISLSGVSPVTRSLIPNKPTPIPSFLNSGALLLEIYGNGSNEACELVVGSKGGSGCNGKARFGCWTCTMSSKDKSSMAISEYERWRVLGSEYALRVRDWLFRTGHSNENRAFHARAYDPITFNRILLQPNILKASKLEKMVWYASQLTQYSERVAREFSELVRQGRASEFSGYRDILEDKIMNPKARSEFAEMYLQEAQEPLIQCFSEKHAILLSVRWSLDGITAAPYRPLAIWNRVQNGESLPWPKTMSEHEAISGPFKMDKVLPNALALPVLKEWEFSPESYARSELDLLSLYEMPTHYSQIWESDVNCSMHTSPKASQKVTVPYELQLRLSDEALPNCVGTLMPYTAHDRCLLSLHVGIESLSVGKIKLGGRILSDQFLEFVHNDIEREVVSQIVDMVSGLHDNMYRKSFNDIESAKEYAVKGLRAIESQTSVQVSLPYLKQVNSENGIPRLNPIKVARKFASTLRVVTRENGVIKHTNTRLRTYSASLIPRYEQSQLSNMELLDVSFDTKNHYTLSLQSDPTRLTSELVSFNNLDFNEEMYSFWCANSGREKALALHDSTLKLWVRNRRDRKSYNFRKYGGTFVAESMFREGGLGVQRSYQEQLSVLLQRTHLFAEIGAFNFANMSYKQLLASGVCIPMHIHRSDKAKVLLAIRTIRNQRRTNARSIVDTNNFVEPIQRDLESFFANWKRNSELGLKLGFEGRMNAVFFDNPVSLVERSNAYRTLLRVYALTEDFQDLLQSLYGRNLLNQLHHHKQLLPLARTLPTIVQPHIDELSRILERYEAKLRKLQALHNNFIFGDNESMNYWREQWALLTSTTHCHVDEYIAFSPDTKRNEENFLKLVEENINFLETECAFQRHQLTEVKSMLSKASHLAMKRLSLNERLTEMTSCSFGNAA